jgi:hypothetical protein
LTCFGQSVHEAAVAGPDRVLAPDQLGVVVQHIICHMIPDDKDAAA